MHRFPAKQCVGFLRVCPEGRKVTIPAGAYHIREFHVIRRFKSMNQFQNGDAIPRQSSSAKL